MFEWQIIVTVDIQHPNHLANSNRLHALYHAYNTHTVTYIIILGGDMFLG